MQMLCLCIQRVNSKITGCVVLQSSGVTSLVAVCLSLLATRLVFSECINRQRLFIVSSRLASGIIISRVGKRSGCSNTFFLLPLHQMFFDISNVQWLSLKDSVGNDWWQPHQIYLLPV